MYKNHTRSIFQKQKCNALHLRNIKKLCFPSNYGIYATSCIMSSGSDCNYFQEISLYSFHYFIAYEMTEIPFCEVGLFPRNYNCKAKPKLISVLGSEGSEEIVAEPIAPLLPLICV